MVFAWIRVLCRGEWRGFSWKAIDVVVLLWALCAGACDGIGCACAPVFVRGGRSLVTELMTSQEDEDRQADDQRRVDGEDRVDLAGRLLHLVGVAVEALRDCIAPYCRACPVVADASNGRAAA